MNEKIVTTTTARDESPFLFAIHRPCLTAVRLSQIEWDADGRLVARGICPTCRVPVTFVQAVKVAK